MLVNDLWIISVEGISEPTEITSGARTLFEKYKMRGETGQIHLIHVNQSKHWKLEAEHSAQPVRTQERQNVAKNVGVYVYGHGSKTNALGCLSPSELASLLVNEGELGLGLKAIDKICLLSCRVAGKDKAAIEDYRARDAQVYSEKEIWEFQEKRPVEGSPEDKQWLHIVEDLAHLSFLTFFCAALAEKGPTPLVAGWDSFVSIAYEGSKYNPPGLEYIAAQHHGKKLVGQGNAKRFVTSPDRSGHKKVFQWQRAPLEQKVDVFQWQKSREKAGYVMKKTVTGWSQRS